MTVDRREVERIAALARLSLSDEEAERLTAEMNEILEHAMRLRRSAAETDAVSGAAADAGSSGTRSDRVTRPDELLTALSDFAPAMVDGFFVVPPPPGVGVGPEPVSPDDGA